MRYDFTTYQFFFAQRESIKRDLDPVFSNNGGGNPISPGYKRFCGKWGWYKTIADLATDKILLFDQITKKTVVEVFGFLLYQIDKAHAERDQMNFERQIRRR